KAAVHCVWAEAVAPPSNPMVGRFTPCARAASGQAAAPPSSVMNSRRLTSGMGSPSEPAGPAYRKRRMPRKRPQVFEGDLNRSESSRQRACPRLPLPPPPLRERRAAALVRRLSGRDRQRGVLRLQPGAREIDIVTGELVPNRQEAVIDLRAGLLEHGLE